MEVKSRLFHDNPTISKELGEHLKLIAGAEIDEEIQKQLAGAVAGYYLAPNAIEESKALEGIRSSWTKDAETLRVCIGIGGFLLRELDEFDKAADIQSDLQTLGFLEKDEVDKIASFLTAIVSVFQESILRERRDIATQQFGIKTLSGMGYKADLRVVISNPHEKWNETKIEQEGYKYAPKVSNLVPVGIIHLLFPDDENVVFQLDYRTLDILQRKLTELRAELDVAIAFVKPAQVRKGRT